MINITHLLDKIEEAVVINSKMAVKACENIQKSNGTLPKALLKNSLTVANLESNIKSLQQ